MTSSIVSTILLSLMTLPVVAGQGQPVVDTNLGRIQGRVRRTENIFVFRFLGVRYAVAPVGRLRFKKPVPIGRWNGVFDATQFGPSCAQLASTRWLPNRATTEDCLVMNVYVPRTLNPEEPKSVMVWIHGGGFVAGQGMGRDGSLLAVRGDVIVVTINYRLDVFGFLSTGDNNSLGNYGLWDQHVAIRFVKDNIAAFGGNPESMTIFGESGGGYSVGLHALSPLSVGLFQRALCESGVGLSPRAIAFDPVNFTRRFAENLGCSRVNADGSFNNSLFMTCLRRRNTDEILQASAQARRPSSLAWRLEIAPTVDGEIVPRHPEYLISRENTNLYNPMPDIDFMAGINNGEGNLIFWPLRNFQRQLNFSMNQGIPTRVLCDHIAPSLTNDYYNGTGNISQGMCRLYTSTEGPSEQGQNVVNLYGDMMFVAPTVMTATIHSLNRNGRRTYMYLFSQQDNPNASPWWFQGAGHGAELSYVFGRRRLPNQQLSRQMMSFWTNFAKFGDPNGSPESTQGQWQTYNFPDKNYISLGETVEPQRDLWPERMTFWTSEVPVTMDRNVRIPQPTPSWATTAGTTPSRGQGQGQNGGTVNTNPGQNPSAAPSSSGYVRYLGTYLSTILPMLLPLRQALGIY